MEKEREKLEQMITDNQTYENILKQSQILDKYIAKAITNQIKNK